MPAPHLSNRKEQMWVVAGVSAVIIIAVSLAVAFRPAKKSAVTNTTNISLREQYATLYQAAWRQDSGQGNVTVTATLMAPHLMSLLGQDTERSSAEEQLWQSYQGLSDRQLGIFLTIDSAGSPLTDDTIAASGTLTATGATLTPVAWHPFIAPSHIVNTDVPSAEQTGVLVFGSSTSIPWSTIKNITLTIKGIDEQPDRHFSWVTPQILQP